MSTCLKNKFMSVLCCYETRTVSPKEHNVQVSGKIVRRKIFGPKWGDLSNERGIF
jgi:hypothetical protein